VQQLEGRVAVVTGGASGIGRAMASRFASEGMRVVVADVEAPALDITVAELQAEGFDVSGAVTDVSEFASVEALRNTVLATHGAVHVVCNNAGVGAGAAGQMWDHTLNDWRWALGVNVWGVIIGIMAFVPAIYAQLRSVGAKVSASGLVPGPHVLRTGLVTSGRNRPDSYANPGPPARPPTTIESFEKVMADRGIELVYTPVEEVAGAVVDAIRADRFWILPASERSDQQIRARADSMLTRSNPTYIRDLGG
jgi:hypothetical protein